MPQVIDVVVSDRLDASAQAVVKAVDAVLDEDMILDLGPQTMAAVLPMIQGPPRLFGMARWASLSLKPSPGAPAR